ncbi:MAG: hypothetical protein CMQ07_03665, partial [Gammaproteobacteria bacterium]|nr:hypothetical protein [Gammaproteobacteria bacterium]
MGCARGFKRIANACDLVAVPENAYLDASGTDWQCQRGYLKQREDCEAIRVPEHAYLIEAQYGRGWDCDCDCDCDR